jgi:hypothetical protein
MKTRLMPTMIVMMAIMAVASMPAGANVTVARQGQDYQANNNGHPDTLGSGHWYYLYADVIAVPDAQNSGLLVWNSTSTEYDMGGSDYYPDVWMTPGGLTMTPEVGGGTAARYAIMRWESGVNGVVNVAGT